MPEPASHLRATGLRKRYGDQEVVCGVDLELRPGECFGLLGPNGAGKTTTLRLCLGLIEPDAGSIEVLGLPVPERAREARLPASRHCSNLRGFPRGRARACRRSPAG